MNKIYTIARIVFGLMMIGSGLAMLILGGFPTEYENAIAQVYMNALEETGFFIPLLAIVKIVCGVAWVSNRFVPLALVIFMPVSVNMVIFHLALEPLTGVGAYVIFILNIYIMVKNLPSYKMLLKSKTN